MAVRPCPDDKGVARRGAPSPAKIAILSLEVLDPLGRLIAPDPDPAYPGPLGRALVVPGSASAPRGTVFALTGARAFIWLHPLRSAGARGDRPEGSRLEGSSSRRGSRAHASAGRDGRSERSRQRLSSARCLHRNRGSGWAAAPGCACALPRRGIRVGEIRVRWASRGDAGPYCVWGHGVWV